MKSSVFFRRTLALVLSGVILTSLLSAILYMFITRSVFINIRSDELMPVARSIASFIAEEDDKSAISNGFFFRAISNENTNFVDATVYALDADGELLVYSNEPSPNRPSGPFGRTPSNNDNQSIYDKGSDSDLIVGAESPDEASQVPGESTAADDADSGSDSGEPPGGSHAPGSSPPPDGSLSSGGSPPSGDAPQSDNSPPPAKPSSSGSSSSSSNEDRQADMAIIKQTFESVKQNGELTTTAVSKENSIEYLVLGVPITSDDGTFEGAVIITKPVVELSEKLEGLNVTLIISAIITCLIMVIPAFIAGKRLTDPIRDIQSVALSMSMGDFSKRANEHQAGEVGELAVAINEFADKSEKLEQTRRDYVANISHELRTPIASIRAMSETLRDGLLTDDEKRQRYYDHILRESMRLTRLVDDLLELSRLQSRGVALKCEDTDLLPVLDASAITFEQTAADAGVHFHFERPDALPLTYTNADRIEQILIILIDNAIKHTPDDGTVTLSVNAGETMLRIKVADTGEGISAEDIPHVFERFYKSDKSRSGSGTGLGLSIAREVLEMMGETISVTSELGKGSVFTFTVHLSKQ